MEIMDKITQAKQMAINNFYESKFTYEAILSKIQQSNAKNEQELLMQANVLLKAKNTMDFWFNKVKTGGMN